MICLLFKSLKTVLLIVLMKSNCCIYSYIPNYSFFIFYFWFLKKSLGSDGSPVRVEKRQSTGFFFIVSVFIVSTGLDWLNIFQVFYHYFVVHLADIQLIFKQLWPRDNFLNCLCNAFWMSQSNGCVHYMKVRTNENLF